MQPAVEALLRLGPMPEDGCADIAVVEQYHAATAALERPASNEEAVALIAVLPAGEWDLFGLAWSVLHFIETAPGWPIREVLLDGQGPWVANLRAAAEQGGLL